MNLKASVLCAFGQQKYRIGMILIFGIIIAISTTAIPGILGKCYQAISSPTQNTGLLPLIYLTIAYSIRSLFKLGRNHLAATSGTNIVRCLRSDILRALGGGDIDSDSLTLYSLCSHDLETISSLVSHKSFAFLENLYVLSFSFYLIFSFNHAIFLSVLPFLCLLIGAGCLYGVRINKIVYDASISVSEISSTLYEMITTQKAIRTLRAQDYFGEKFNAKVSRNRDLNTKLSIKNNNLQTVLDFLSLSAMVVCILGSTLVMMRGGASSEILLTMYNYMILLLTTSKSISEIILFFVTSKQSLVRINEQLRMIKVADNRDEKKKKILMELSQVELKKAIYEFDGQRHQVNSLLFKKGEISLITGSSGSGKTLLADTLVGLYTPQKSQILVNNECDITDVDISSFRKRIGYAMQTPVLFHDTLKYNIFLGRDVPDKEYLNLIFEEVGIFDIASSLQNGMDTLILGESNTLSGGQKQRISLARALVTNPDLILLDDIFTALDPQRQEKIIKLLSSLKKNHIIIIISNYDSMQQIADRIYNMDEILRL